MNRNLLLGGLAAAVIVVAIVILLAIRPGKNLDDGAMHIVFATDWKAQAEHGGFYQALAKGYYKDAGLDVTIQQGGPGVNVPQLLATNTVQFGMGSNSFIPLNVVVAKAGSKAVMASFQKDPQVLITHPRDDVKSIADMKGKPILVADATVSSFWPWLKAKYGFTDSQIRKYTFNLAPFLTDKKAIQEGYLSSEPYTIEKEGKFKPQVFLLSDNGYPGYAAFVMATDEMISDHPDVVQKFVDASIKGWTDYLYGDPSPANALIKAANPEMTDELIAHGLATLKAHGVVDSGDTETLGIGAMTDKRWQAFYDEMSAAGIFAKGIDVHSAYTLEFVNHDVGRDLKKELTKK
ncbi:MAG: ABC transporter substrate-binding protein [Parvibaculum sp.]|uniref:ABC transporter substrate-binding protein n=1 Tax=Parvibaculum sp. TaxID=2024848 RepID=UPI0026010444|nr:ABC transporter substrate-binding protein [Parvibaculum sp.]MCE9649565.1 ABC transporter substrate-binding protein [Parvibaculum sp.]